MFKKLLGSVAIVGGSVFIGKNLSDRLKKRKDSLNAFHTALVMLEGEIAFSANSIDYALKNISNTTEISECLNYMADELKNIGIRKAWNNGIIKFKDKLCLTDNDVKILQTLSSELGITDRENQIKNIKYVLSILEVAENDANEKFNSHSGLYRNISVSVGLAFSILLM